MDQARQMDRMYRFQRHWYDFSREYYLLGRDRMIRQIEIHEGSCVLEMACGTARNLLALSSMHPSARLYGMDASDQMLKTAREKVLAAGKASQIQLAQGLAENIDYRDFNLQAPFDAILFSYGLSMIPSWNQAVHAALNNLKSGGRLYIVDFWDQHGLPSVFRGALKSWLALFGVFHRRELLEHLRALASEGRGELSIEPVFRGYAYIATFTKGIASTGLPPLEVNSKNVEGAG